MATSKSKELSLDERRERLIALGAETLADSLLDLCAHSVEAEKLVERSLASPKENSRRFRQQIAGVKRSTQFIDYRSASALAAKLRFLLEEIERGVTDPNEGLDLIRRFVEADASIFNRCDDSSGVVGDVYRTDVTRLFSDYAKKCEDKALVAKLLIELQHNNDYGARDSLIETASSCMPEEIMRDTMESLITLAKKEPDTYRNSKYYIPAESLAKQLKDPGKFEAIRREFHGELSTSSHIDIAEEYLNKGEADVALQWLNRIDPKDHFRQFDRDSLYEAVYRISDDKDALVTLLRGRFQNSPSEQTLQTLLNEVGEDKRLAIIKEQISYIRQDKTLHTSNASFMLSIGAIDEAADYIIERAEQLNGSAYFGLTELAKKFTSANRHLAASLLYRCLLHSILEEGRTKAYAHGAKYMSLLDRLAPLTADWCDHPDHDHFKADIVERHGRKRSFWAKYSGKPSLS